MFLLRSSCVLCGERIDKIKYNLKTTYSETSNILLIKFVEKLYENVFLMHCNICTSCFSLLNELDDVQARQKKLYSKLKNYVAKMQNSSIPSDGDIKVEAEPKDSFEENSYFLDITNDEIKPTECRPCFNSDITKIGDIDLKKLPIKIKRVTSGKAVHDVFDSKSKSSNPQQVTENQEAFEKIQSSIQMDLSKHVQEHMNKNKPTKDVLCDVCGQHFKTRLGFENHIKKHGGAEDDMKLLVMNKKDECFTCEICGKMFNQRIALSRHLFIHTGQTRYQCEECGKKFVHHSSFNLHRKIHAGQRNFKCADCNKDFLTRSHLKRHLRAAHHSNRKEHSCEICGKKFTENYNLIAHVKVVHKHQDEEVYFEEEVIGESEVYYDM